jgi:DNA-binding response OmpR family regulator
MSTQIVVVDNDPNAVEAMRKVFLEHRITNHVQVFGTGEEALDFLLARGTWAGRPGSVPHLVLLGLELPGMPGLDVLAALRNDVRTRRVPVVVMSRADGDADVGRGYELGANSIIVKPMDFSSFATAVRMVGLYWAVLNEPPFD